MMAKSHESKLYFVNGNIVTLTSYAIVISSVIVMVIAIASINIQYARNRTEQNSI